jgi:hypothetical protein
MTQRSCNYSGGPCSSRPKLNMVYTVLNLLLGKATSNRIHGHQLRTCTDDKQLLQSSSTNIVGSRRRRKDYSKKLKLITHSAK